MNRTNASLAELAVRVRHPVLGEKKPREGDCLIDAKITAAFLVTVFCSMLSMSSELRNFEVIFATGVSRLEVIASHLISNFMVFFLQELYVSTILVWDHPIRGSLIAFLTLRILNGVQGSALGVAIAFGRELCQRRTLHGLLGRCLGILLMSVVIYGR